MLRASSRCSGSGPCAKALELGASDEGPPGERIPNVFYGAYVRDPDGHKLCFMEMKVG